MKRSCLANPAQLKKTPFFSRPSTEIKFAAGSGGVSDWNGKPGCSADQTIVVLVLKKVLLNCCDFGYSKGAVPFIYRTRLSLEQKTPPGSQGWTQ